MKVRINFVCFHVYFEIAMSFSEFENFYCVAWPMFLERRKKERQVMHKMIEEVALHLNDISTFLEKS